jgi:hypothetical protein
MFAQRTFLIGLLFLATLAWPLHAFAAQLTLTWTDASDNEAGFKVERRMGLTGTYGEIAMLGANTTSYVDPSLAASTTYCYRVRAFNGAGDSGYSNEACATTPAAFALTVVRSGTGSGSVNGTPSGISCGADCSEGYASGTSVTLSAAAAAGSTFDGWSGGGCAGTGSCGVLVTTDTIVTATFSPVVSEAPLSVALLVSKAGKGGGSVSSSPNGIACGTDCTESYPSGTSVTLTAAPDPGSAFAGWSGVCSGKGICAVTLTADTSVTATFRRYHARK